jgi:hypothetical protein
MKTRIAVILGAILLASLSRTLPHPINFWPVTAMALFAGATLADKRLALLVPLLSLFVSDCVIEILHRMDLMASWGFYKGQWGIYATMVLITLIGFLVHRRRNLLTIVAGTLAGSVVFFLATNFLVWVTGSLDINNVPYPRTLDGLLYCYSEGLKWFRNQFLGDVCYATLLFGGFALAERLVPVLRAAPVMAPEKG